MLGMADHRARSRRGFTLLEILIALSIVGSSLVIVLGNINHAVLIYRVAKETAVATNIAQERLQSVLSSKDRIREMSDSGRVKDDPRFDYAVSVTEFSLPGFEKNDLAGLFRVEVTVRWSSSVQRQVRLVQITTAQGDRK